VNNDKIVSKVSSYLLRLPPHATDREAARLLRGCVVAINQLRADSVACETCNHQATSEGCPNCLSEEVAKLRGGALNVDVELEVLNSGIHGEPGTRPDASGNPETL